MCLAAVRSEQSVRLCLQISESLFSSAHFFPASSAPFQLLIQSEADLFVEDQEKLTPCDHAERHNHTELALSLESQMVFSSSSCRHSNSDPQSESTLLQYKDVRAHFRDHGFH